MVSPRLTGEPIHSPGSGKRCINVKGCDGLRRSTLGEGTPAYIQSQLTARPGADQARRSQLLHVGGFSAGRTGLTRPGAGSAACRTRAAALARDQHVHLKPTVEVEGGRVYVSVLAAFYLPHAWQVF